MSTNFPTSMDSYPTKTDNIDDVMAADINNPQDAIVAIENKIGIDGDSDPTTHDNKLANMGWQNSGSTVFNTAMGSSSTFQDLDLSSVVGSGYALVLLEVNSSSSGTYIAKPKGYGSSTFTDHYSYYGQAFGCGVIHFEASGEYAYVLVATDSSGVIQHGAGHTNNLTIKVVGYLKAP